MPPGVLEKIGAKCDFQNAPPSTGMNIFQPNFLHVPCDSPRQKHFLKLTNVKLKKNDIVANRKMKK